MSSEPKIEKKQKMNDGESKPSQELNELQQNDQYIEDEISLSECVQQQPKQRTDCPYLSTIRRHLLDFDFEKLCSVTLNNLNVYACLVCGKYYQGRGKGTYAYMHSLEADHHVFINLHNTNVYCLPDNYEVIDQSLWDIKYNLRPHYTKEQLLALDLNQQESRGLDGSDFLPGFVGLNNLNNTDYVNVAIQALCRIPQLRDFFIFYEYKKYTSDVFDFKTLLTKRFAELIRKIWNAQNFKGHVSPHELLQAISIRSGKKFKIGQQSDPIQLLAWFLDNLDKELMTINRKYTIIRDCFQGEVEISLYRPLRKGVGYETEPIIETKTFQDLSYLTLDIPPVPLHKNENQSDKTMIPHIPIFDLLKKFDGITNKDSADGRRKFKIKRFPKYLLLHMRRFTMNNFFMEKNSTIVSFPLDNLDLKPYLNLDDEEELQNINLKFNLLANICHEGDAKVGFYKVHVRNKAKNAWYVLQDLHIAPIMPQLITVSEAYIQIYEQVNE